MPGPKKAPASKPPPKPPATAPSPAAAGKPKAKAAAAAAAAGKPKAKPPRPVEGLPGIRSAAELLATYGPEDFLMGIDEAGRGPVLGPMVYACAFCRLGDADRLPALGVGDSKQITEANRDKAAERIRASDFCEGISLSLHPKQISGWMQRRAGDYNLNTMSHDSATLLIDEVLRATGGPQGAAAGPDSDTPWEGYRSLVATHVPPKGFGEWKKPCRGRLRGVFVDTVGVAADYQQRLARRFPFLHITVESKADSSFPVVGAASIIAKTTRDYEIANWKFEEPGLSGRLSTAFGSGYPADPDTVKWLTDSMDPEVLLRIRGAAVRVFGSPPSLLHARSRNAAFSVRTEEELACHWAKRVPDDGVDILVTHQPPISPLLADVLSAKRPRLHVCGHEHEARGPLRLPSGVLSINAATVGERYRPRHPPIVVDLPLATLGPPGP